MKRIWNISKAIQLGSMLIYRCSAELRTPLLNSLTKRASVRRFLCDYVHPPQTMISSIVPLFSAKMNRCQRERICERLRVIIPSLRDELLRRREECENVVDVLEEKCFSLFKIYVDGSAFVELLHQLYSWPKLCLEIFNWRRNQTHIIPMTAEEYAKGIRVAGRLKNINLAIELFMEASIKQIKTASTYNALMSAYMLNGATKKCLSLFQDMKREPAFSPTIVTYNILISVFGRLNYIDSMEATFKDMQDQNLSPTVSTYNNLIAGYVTAWMCDSMEKTYRIMKEGDVKPNLSTDLLMLRGYANSGNVEKMEESYARIKYYVDQDVSLIRAMICAYCRISKLKVNRIKRIEELASLIPEGHYSPGLNVLLIKVYAQEDLIEEMDCLIDQAFEHNTAIFTNVIMRCIIASYFRSNSVDRLVNFVKRAEYSGWKICRSLYHCKMTMYGLQNRLAEMEKVLDEMASVNFKPSKKTFWILYKAYSSYGLRQKVEQIFGLMCKYGYGIPLETCPS